MISHTIRVHFVALALALIAAIAAAQAPRATAAKIKSEGLQNSHAMKFLDHLTNQIGHRLTGSDNFTTACEWAREEFEKMGLEARLEEWGEWNIVWNRGQWSGRVLSPEPMELQVATPAWTAGTKGAQRGLLVRMPNIDQLEKSGGEYRGKYLLGKIPSYRRGDDYKKLMHALAASGAIALVAPPAGRLDRRYATQIRVFGNSLTARGSMANLPTVPLICVRPDQYKKIAAMVDAGKEVELECEIRNRFRRGPIALHNVVADLVGSEKPDEYVIVCGHLDSWHQATGATDNGTGTASTMEAARILTAVGAKPKRTIRFILWGGEEQGLLGSHRFVTQHRSEMARVSAVLNHDSGTNWAHSLTVTPAMVKDMEKVFAPVMSMPIPQKDFDGQNVFVLRTRETISASGGSDHASFGVAGVPAWSWGLQGRGNRPYGYGWHSQWDTYDIAVPAYQAHTSTVIALAALGVANLPTLLSREGVVRGRGRRGRGGSADSLVGVVFGAEMKGATFVKVEKAGPAEAAGVQAGDKILRLNGEKLNRTFEILGAVRDRVAAIILTVQRGDRSDIEIKFETESLVKRLQSRQRRRGDRRRRRRAADAAATGDARKKDDAEKKGDARKKDDAGKKGDAGKKDRR